MSVENECDVARATVSSMVRRSTQRELRNESGEIMRALHLRESFVVTCNGVAVGALVPVRRRRLVPANVFVAALSGAPHIDPQRFQTDVDAFLDQDRTPRA